MPHLPDHATHDPELIAAYAAGDAAGPDLALATELVAACTDCADLHRDLRAIATALPELPVPARPRDFRLTPEQASALGPSGWRAVLAAFGSPRFRLAAPLGTGLAAVGLAGLLLATPGSLLPRSATSGAGAGAPAPAAAEATSGPEAPNAAGIDTAGGVAAGATGDQAAAASPAASAAAQLAPEAVPAPSTSIDKVPDDAVAVRGSAAASDGRNSGTVIERPAPSSATVIEAPDQPFYAATGDPSQTESLAADSTADSTGNPLLVVLAAAALLAGLALVALRLGARRLT